MLVLSLELIAHRYEQSSGVRWLCSFFSQANTSKVLLNYIWDRLYVIMALLTISLFPAYVLAENEPGPMGQGDLDGDLDVDMNDVDLLGLFLNGTLEPEQWQFWCADIYPYTLNGSDLCPQGDGELTEWDYETLFYIAAQEYNFAWRQNCPYDFDRDGYVDHRYPGGDDCDDTRDFVNPGQIEECGGPTCSDNFDNDCDGLTDAADPDCQEWCATAAEASTIGTAGSSSSKPINLLAILLVPIAVVVIRKGMRSTR